MIKLKSWLFVYLVYVELCFAQFFFVNGFNFLTKSHFYYRFFLNLNELSDGKVVSFTKNENSS